MRGLFLPDCIYVDVFSNSLTLTGSPTVSTLTLSTWNQHQVPQVRASQVVLVIKKNKPSCQCKRHKKCGFDPWVGKMPWRRAWQHTPIFLLESPMDRGLWQAIVHTVAKSWSRLKRLNTHIHKLKGSLPHDWPHFQMPIASLWSFMLLTHWI